jgi:RNA polymerase sigma-70 factor (ECF subfamily)
MELPFEDKVESDIMVAVLSLPPKYKDVIYLFYYEQYTVPDMAKLLNQKENTIYSNLHRARELLKRELGGIDYAYIY